MNKSRTIAIVLLVALGLVVIGIAVTFRWRTEVRRNLRLSRQETRRRKAQTIASQMLSAMREPERRTTRGRSRSAARRTVQNRTRRSSRRVSPFREQIRRVAAAANTTGKADRAVKQQPQRQRLPSPAPAPPTPAPAPPSSPTAPPTYPPAQPVAPPPSPPRPSSPAEVVESGGGWGGWSSNDAQVPGKTQESSQKQTQGQALDDWGQPQGGLTASGGREQTQNSPVQTQGQGLDNWGQPLGGLTGSSGRAQTQNSQAQTQGQALDDWGQPLGGLTASSGRAQTQNSQAQIREPAKDPWGPPLDTQGQSQNGWTPNDAMAQRQSSGEWNANAGIATSNIPTPVAQDGTDW